MRTQHDAVPTGSQVRGWRGRRIALAILTATAVVGGLTVVAPAQAMRAAPVAAAPVAAVAVAVAPVQHRSCAAAAPGTARCLSRWQRGGARVGGVPGRAVGAVAPPATGLVPADIVSAYRLDTTAGVGQTIAIVDAFDNPNAERDLKTYRATFGLSPCTTANGCFRKVNQSGGSTPPEPDVGWGVEIALDLQAVSAACPNCRILLVEGNNNSLDSLGTAVKTAVRLGADVVSNSYGTDGEFTGVLDFGRKYYTHPGVAQVASSGDFGFTQAGFPADLGQVIAAGGTTLTPRTNGGWTERAWGGAGSGCSAWVAKPAWQHDPNCPMRTISDVSAVADNYAVYDTFGLGADNGWITVAGTSISAPLLAGMIGLAGNAASLDSARFIYNHRAGLKDVIGGRNGFCGGDYLCTALKGYDGPTGLGAPRGVSGL